MELIAPINWRYLSLGWQNFCFIFTFHRPAVKFTSITSLVHWPGSFGPHFAIYWRVLLSLPSPVPHSLAAGRMWTSRPLETRDSSITLHTGTECENQPNNWYLPIRWTSFCSKLHYVPHITTSVNINNVKNKHTNVSFDRDPLYLIASTHVFTRQTVKRRAREKTIYRSHTHS